ncbi:MAG: response regulator [Anaerolineales bacterium]|nr:MAG: response regulator [Anaerolineales bacterium]
MTKKTDVLLLVEDDPNDILLFEKAIEKSLLPIELIVLRDGEKAISYLSGSGKFEDRKRYPLPNLILVDLKLPRKSGFDVIQWVKNHPELKIIPVIVLSSSNQAQDVNLAYGLGTNSYLVKPIGFNELSELIEAFGRYWLSYNERPPKRLLPNG